MSRNSAAQKRKLLFRVRAGQAECRLGLMQLRTEMIRLAAQQLVAQSMAGALISSMIADLCCIRIVKFGGRGAGNSVCRQRLRHISPSDSD